MSKNVLSIVACLLFFPVMVFANSVDDAGYVKTALGHISIVRGSQVIIAEVGSGIKSNDVIITSKDASVGIVFRDNTRLSLGEMTELDIKEYKFTPVDKEYSFSLYLKRGKVLYTSGKLSKLAPESIDFQTPRATVGVRGTKFLVEVD